MQSSPGWARNLAALSIRWRCSSKRARRTSICWISHERLIGSRLGPVWPKYKARAAEEEGVPSSSALGGNVLLSILWPVGVSPAELLGLSPALAVAVARALESEGVDGIGLKWPNDIHVGGRKVCGILLEVGQDGREGRVLVAGIGINVQVAASVGREIDQPWTDLHRELGRRPSRNRLAGRIIDQVMRAERVYLEQGFGPFRSEYRARDILEGREVRLVQAATEWRGLGHGLDENGALLVESAGRVTAHLSGDVSVRLDP